MSFIPEINRISMLDWSELPKESICIDLCSEIYSPEEAVQKTSSIKGPVDVYCWYEAFRDSRHLVRCL